MYKNKKDVSNVRINIVLAHPFNFKIKILPCVTNKESLLADWGVANYNYAVKQGWITEIIKKNILTFS